MTTKDAQRMPAVLAEVSLVAAGVAATVLPLILMPASAGLPKYLVIVLGLWMAGKGGSVLGRRLRGPRFDLGYALSVIWVAALGLVSIFADLLPLREHTDVSQTFSVPIRQRPNLFSAHPLGTDGQGLDLLGGIVYGARVSLMVGFGAVTIGLVVGLLLGVVAGYFRGRLDTVVSFLTDSMLAFPPLILLLAMVAALRPSVLNVSIALAVISTPTFIRISRANTMVFAQRDFVTSARLLGDRNSAIMLREILPNVALPVVSFSFVIIAIFIVAEASLSFLGLSISRPNPTWGNMIASGQNRLNDHPHIVFVPGIVLFLTVFAFNRLGDRARSIWDTREAKL